MLLGPACRSDKESAPGESKTEAAGKETPGLERRGTQPRPAAPDPSEVLEDDLAAGRITLSQAARFRLLRLFRPSQVPVKYRYREAPRSGTWDVLQVVRQFQNLDPAAAEELLPYLVRPTDPRSVYHKRLYGMGAASRPARFSLAASLYADDNLVKEVYHTDTGYIIEILGEREVGAVVAKARQLVERHKIYEKFERLLHRKTLDYGDRTLFIYIFPTLPEVEDEAGKKFIPAGFCYSDRWVPGSGIEDEQTSAAWIQINADLTREDKELASTLAHEMFHAFQFAFSTQEEKWLDEGTAVWSEDFIGPEWNEEQDYLEGNTFTSEGFAHNTLTEKASENAYGMYLFFYYLTRVRSGGGGQVMRRIWENCSAQKAASLDSVKKAIGGEFEEVFKDYALNTMDEGEVKGKFPDTVGEYRGHNPLPLSDIHSFLGLYHIDEDGSIIPRGGVHVEEMAIHYYQVTNAAKGSMAPTIRFDLKEFKGRKEVGIQAIVEYGDGHTEKEDWSDLDERVFCLGLSSQNFDTIYLAVSLAEENAEKKDFKCDLHKAGDVECVTGQMQITHEVRGQDRVRTRREDPGFKLDEAVTRDWHRQMTFTLDLVRQRHSTKSEAEQLSGKLPKDIRKSALQEFLRPDEGYDDENTGCRVYPLRVKNVRLNGFMRRLSIDASETENDAMGLTLHTNRRVDEHWWQDGLAEDTEEWLDEEDLEVRVYVDHGSNRIRWVKLSGPVGLKAKGKRWSHTDGRKRVPTRDGQLPGYVYNDISRSGSNDLEDTMKVGVVSDTDKDLPLNPDWKAQGGSSKSAKGEGKKDRPLNRELTDEDGTKTVITGNETKTLKWQLRLEVSPPSK